jgi:hypothetical protein
MRLEERDGIVSECFRERRYFLRQPFQSLPSVILIFSQSTANAFVGEMVERFTVGAPRVGEPLRTLMKREVRMRYGILPDGTALEARVIFAPHITGDAHDFAEARSHVVNQLVDEARSENIVYNPETRHLQRPPGACVFCTMLEIGPCDYADELTTLSAAPHLMADSAVSDLQTEKSIQMALLTEDVNSAPVAQIWAASDDGDEHSPDELPR